MDSITIETDRLNLILETPEEVLARIEAMPPEDRAQVSPQWLAQMRTEKHANPWKHGFRMVDRASRIVVGGCAFKGPPDYHGVVEIAYGVEPEYRQRGYATEAAQALVDFAFAHNVKRVRAHTLVSNDASIGVLLNCGFCLVGEVIEPDDGPVLRWELVNPLLLPQ